jgi:hypothetical protein
MTGPVAFSMLTRITILSLQLEAMLSKMSHAILDIFGITLPYKTRIY